MKASIESIEFVHGIPEEMRSAAATLYHDAFGAKFAVAVSSFEKRIAVLQNSLNLRFAIGAVIEGELIGLAGYKTTEGSLTDGITYRTLIRSLGPIRGTWTAFILSIYERTSPPHELLMDGIVVDAGMRGLGIGAMLLDKLAAFASSSGYSSLRLDVIDTNPRARRMYERNGFISVGTEHFACLRWLLGFGASTTLVRDVSTMAGSKTPPRC